MTAKDDILTRQWAEEERYPEDDGRILRLIDWIGDVMEKITEVFDAIIEPVERRWSRHPEPVVQDRDETAVKTVMPAANGQGAAGAICYTAASRYPEPVAQDRDEPGVLPGLNHRAG